MEQCYRECLVGCVLFVLVVSSLLSVSFGGNFISLLKCGGYWEMEVMNPVLENLNLIYTQKMQNTD